MAGPSECRMADSGAMSSKIVEWIFKTTITPVSPAHWSTKILSNGEKIFVSDVFLDTELKYVSRISLSPTYVAPG